LTWIVISGSPCPELAARSAVSLGAVDTPSEEDTDICSVEVAFGDVMIEVLMDELSEERISKESVVDIVVCV